MSFAFALAPVLRVRLLREAREERLLQQILLQINHMMNQIRGVEMELARQNQGRARNLPQVEPAHALCGAYAAMADLRRRRSDLGEQLDRLDSLKDQQLATYQAAQRERKTIADLREGAHRVYMAVEAKQEQRRMDAYAAYAHQRRAM